MSKLSVPEIPKSQLSDHPLPIVLSIAVPLWIMRLHQHGTIPDDYQQRLNRIQSVLERNGESILYRTKPGKTAESFNALAEGIALLSFCPGGVHCFGMTFNAEDIIGAFTPLELPEKTRIRRALARYKAEFGWD